MTQQNAEEKNEIQSDIEELQKEVDSLSDVTAGQEQPDTASLDQKLEQLNQRIDGLDIEGTTKRVAAADRSYWQSASDKSQNQLKQDVYRALDLVKEEVNQIKGYAYQNLTDEEKLDMKFNDLERKIEQGGSAQAEFPADAGTQQGEGTDARAEMEQRILSVISASGIPNLMDDFRKADSGQSPTYQSVWDGLNSNMNPDEWIGALQSNIRHYKQVQTAPAPAQAQRQQQQNPPPPAMGGGQRTRTADEIIDAHNKGDDVTGDELSRAYKEKGVS